MSASVVAVNVLVMEPISKTELSSSGRLVPEVPVGEDARSAIEWIANGDARRPLRVDALLDHRANGEVQDATRGSTAAACCVGCCATALVAENASTARRRRFVKRRMAVSVRWVTSYHGSVTGPATGALR